MQSRWSDADAGQAIEVLGAAGASEGLALRVYTTRLLGSEPALVLHGGGNTSLKTEMADLLGERHSVLCVKGSGRDMATIDPSGFSGVRLGPLRSLRGRATLGDDDMMRVQRAYLLDPAAPSPSVEMLLHAFLPHAYVDHTHANAVLSLIDQPDGMDLAREVYGGRMGWVPYRRPGFGLAKVAADVFDTDPKVEGLILDKHGLFTFGATAREAYERMIEMVTLAEARLQRGRKRAFTPLPLPQSVASHTDVAPMVRGICALKNDRVEGAWRRLVLEFRTSDAIRTFVGSAEMERLAHAGVVTPDHTIRTKGWPLILPAPDAGRLAEFKRDAAAAAERYMADYHAYFARNNARIGGGRIMLDPAPRSVLVPGLGLFGLGRTKADAVIAADIAECAIGVIADAEATGTYSSIGEADMFDCEYWPPEQAKLAHARDLPLAGQIAAITGAGGAIGAATARAFAAAGAEVALLDVNFDAARAKAEAIGPTALAIACDVTDAGSVRAAFDRIAETYGGVDIVVSNAGAAWQGRIGEVDEAVLRQSFELNFYGHQRVAQAAVRLMLAQGTGGCLLFNVSKQAVNPGPSFGPYGLPKAATLFLVRQYALDYGADGIRANAVNADRIRSGLLTDDFIKSRSSARGVSEKEYMSGNLLGREVTADDVAQAFLHQALALKTTADVTTVDGGNIAAALR
ncbi:MAG TPA: bifunctional aldolase/short-chain dehydrogenase [Hyphomicrobiaceae bacterium]|nr:bifunctional aldolase/short-chain dehydrogenase [Hyphomicrobiaceae bacterium]